jgi:hypothetical protein
LLHGVHSIFDHHFPLSDNLSPELAKRGPPIVKRWRSLFRFERLLGRKNELLFPVDDARRRDCEAVAHTVLSDPPSDYAKLQIKGQPTVALPISFHVEFTANDPLHSVVQER